MMSCKTFKTINQLDVMEKVDMEISPTPDSEFVVDDSNFIPVSEAIRQLSSNNLSSSVVNQYYDFPTGKDNGMEIPFSRTKEANDISVLSSHISDSINEVSEKIKENQKQRKAVEAFEKELAQAKQVPSVVSETSQKS